MKLTDATKALKVSVDFELRTGLSLRSGLADQFSDDTIEKTGDGKKLHVNGYVWASLLRRSLLRLKKGKETAEQIGKYTKENPLGISPLWCESTFRKLPHTDINPGNRISRKWGSTAIGALYSEELVPPGLDLTLNFSYFLNPGEDAAAMQCLFLDTLWVISEGIETIGGGWSYGHGRLEVRHVRMKVLDIFDSEGEDRTENRKALWQYEGIAWDMDKSWEDTRIKSKEKLPAVARPWVKCRLQARIAKGQLLAIHTATPPLDVTKYDELPDHYVFVRNRIKDGGEDTEAVPCVTGKAFRQALLSAPIERKLRTLGENCCDDTTSHRKEDRCVGCLNGNPCKRRQWFGGAEQGGIVSVGDAEIQGYTKHILHRIALCEHSQQNINLFSGEYLSGGTFNIEIIVDLSRKDADSDGLLREMKSIIAQMTPEKEEKEEKENAPPGWHRLGATSTCTGQISIDSWSQVLHE